jgi:hypothetical protein
MMRRFDKHSIAAIGAVLAGEGFRNTVEVRSTKTVSGAEIPLFWMTLGNAAFTSVRVDGASTESSNISYGQIIWSQNVFGPTGAISETVTSGFDLRRGQAL